MEQTMEQKLSLVTKSDRYTLYRYQPTLLHPLLMDMEPMTLKRRLRYFRNFLRPGKYLVYYLALDDELIGMCAVTPGGPGLKLKCGEREDIILGPSFILKKHRGNRHSNVMFKLVLAHHPDYRYAFDLIADNNLPSRRTSLASGFHVYQTLRISGPLRKYHFCEEGSTHTIYKYDRQQQAK
ncbi:MAG: hypothetical protein IKP82_01305 [Oscillospiraceae bacterium]|nr:hypothetical protein [Oscillospiraceae bacterium]